MVLSPLLTLREAFDVWIECRVLHHQGAFTNARFISTRTERDLRQYCASAALFFRRLPLGEIHAGHLREYQRARSACDKSAIKPWRSADGKVHDWKKPASANLIRKEIGTLIRVMKAAGAWTAELEASFEHVQHIEGDVPQALTPEEQHRWLHVAGSRANWRVVYWYSLVGFQTTAATNELRALRIGDVDLHQGTIQIRREGAKNKYRMRTIPLATAELAAALDELLRRAKRMGADAPHHYLFPLHVTGERYDPLRPMTVWGLRKPWNEVRTAANLPNFTPYDTRHTAITRLAEAGVAIQVAMSMAGHVSRKMQQHYIAVSMGAKRSAVLQAFAGVQWNGAAPEKMPPARAAAPRWQQAAGWR